MDIHLLIRILLRTQKHFIYFLGEKVQFIKRHLGILSSYNPQEERQQTYDFVLHYLKDDGILLTRLLSLNSSDLVVTEIINQLWVRYRTPNRLYSNIRPQRHNHNVPTTKITNAEDDINTSMLNTNSTYSNGNTNHPRQRISRILPLLIPTYKNHRPYSKNEKLENKVSKDTHV